MSETDHKKVVFGCDFAIANSFTLIAKWSTLEGNMIQIGEKIEIHPYDYISVIQYLYGSDTALDELRKFLHQRIEQIFNRERN